MPALSGHVSDLASNEITCTPSVKDLCPAFYFRTIGGSGGRIKNKFRKSAILRRKGNNEYKCRLIVFLYIKNKETHFMFIAVSRGTEFIGNAPSGEGS